VKRIILESLTVAIFFMVTFGTGFVFADTYVVTANYGKRVTEQGTCEGGVGAVTITPEIGSNYFYDYQVIIMELLGGLEVCSGFYAVYDMVDGGSHVYNTTASLAMTIPGVNQFAVQGGYGVGFVTITFGDLTEGTMDDEAITYGHDHYSQICVDLSGTLYTASDPLYQCLYITFSASPGTHVFTGDQFIATVKNPTVDVGVCETIEKVLLQYEQSGPCVRASWGPHCIFEITDNDSSAFVSGETYQFTIGKTTGAKAGIGFESISIRYNGATLPTLQVVRQNATGMPIDGTEPIYQPPPSDQPNQLYVDTTQIVVEVTAQGPGTYEVYAIGYYNTCEATPGDWFVDITTQKIPCGNRFREYNFNILQLKRHHVIAPMMLLLE
jgi:hypothetical protein